MTLIFTDVLEYWRAGVMERWSDGVMENSNTPILHLILRGFVASWLDLFRGRKRKNDMQWQWNGVTIVDENSQVDLDTVYNLLKETYWAKDRSKETIVKTIENSLCFSVFKNGKQIGFARVVTDFAVFSWIADVIIDPRFRGQGIGKFLMQCVTEHPAITSTIQTLRTRDAHGLYEKFNFERSEFMRRAI